MTLWTEVHWHEGMFLRPHHLQAAERRLATLLRATLDSACAFGWGFVELELAAEPLQTHTLRIDRCQARLKDGTWVSVPENTEVAPLNFEAALDAGGGAVELLFGVPQMQAVRPNSISLENPEQNLSIAPRYEPVPVTRRDENTGENPQTLYVRRMRGKLFAAGEDTTGYEILRLCRVRRSGGPGALPELDEEGAGPLLALQVDARLGRLIKSLADEIEARGETVARNARERRMAFTDGAPAHLDQLMKLHALNATHAEVRALVQSPLLHPFNVFVTLSRLMGHLSVFDPDRMMPADIPRYDHDRPAQTLMALGRELRALLTRVAGDAPEIRPFVRKTDVRGHPGLEVELEREWVDQGLEMYVGFVDEEREPEEFDRWLQSTFNMKLASPKRAPTLAQHNLAGLRYRLRTVIPPGLAHRRGLHYFRIERMGTDRTDHWQECREERGIRMSLTEGQLGPMERLQPTLYVILKRGG